MKQLILSGCIASLFGCETPPSTRPGDMSELERVATDYLAAYTARDIDRIAVLLHEQVRIQDPTAAVFGTEVDIVGRDAALSMLEPMFARARDFELSVQRQFFSGSHAVSWVEASYSDSANPDSPAVTIEAVMVLEIVDGLVVRHVDYADYGAAMRQRTAAVRAARAGSLHVPSPDTEARRAPPS